MTEDIILYVRNYLNTNYSVFCNGKEQRELDTIIIKISKSIRNKYRDANKILSGEADTLIDMLTGYVKDDIVFYVDNYLNINYATFYNNVSLKEMKAIILAIIKSVKNRYKDVNKILSGEMDGFILHFAEKYIEHKKQTDEKFQKKWGNYINLKNYIIRHIAENSKYSFGRKNLNFFVEDICCTLFPTYNYNNIMENGGLYDEVDSKLEQLLKDIREYVRIYISDNVIPLTDIDNVFVADEVFNIITNSDDILISDLLLGKYIKKIHDIAEENRKYNQDKRLVDNPDTLQYIRDLIPNNRLNEDLVEKFVISMDNKLRDKKLTVKEIVSGSYDKEILIDFNKYLAQHLRFNVLTNSIQTEGIDDGFKLEEGKNKFKKNISNAIVAILLTGVISVTLSQYFREIKTDAIKENIRKEIGFSNNEINSVYDKDFDVTMRDVIDSYKFYSSFGNESFNYLGFYQAFENCSVGRNVTLDERFHIMDKMLKDIKEEIKYDADYNDLSIELNGNGNYLSFVYDRLEDMGYTEIREDKYKDLLFAYSKARNHNELGNPVKYLTNSQERLLNEVSSKYKEYSEQCLLELNVLRNQEKYGSDLSTDGGRRK